MDKMALKKMLASGTASAHDVLRETPIKMLDEIIDALRCHRSSSEICVAVIERIKTAPLGDFETLEGVYFRYCHGS